MALQLVILVAYAFVGGGIFRTIRFLIPGTHNNTSKHGHGGTKLSSQPGSGTQTEVLPACFLPGLGAVRPWGRPVSLAPWRLAGWNPTGAMSKDSKQQQFDTAGGLVIEDRHKIYYGVLCKVHLIVRKDNKPKDKGGQKRLNPWSTTFCTTSPCPE